MINTSSKIKPIYIDIDKPGSTLAFSSTFNDYLYSLLPYHDNSLVIVCIGSDRATGDSLGPLIGHKLSFIERQFPKVKIYGTLQEPVHAKNLQGTLDTIDSLHSNSLILAIDASLGSMDRIGCVTIRDGPIFPGAGVQKELPPVGDFHITGIVNFNSFMNMAILQSTRLCLVMQMADMISSNIRHCLWKFFKSDQ